MRECSKIFLCNFELKIFYDAEWRHKVKNGQNDDKKIWSEIYILHCSACSPQKKYSIKWNLKKKNQRKIYSDKREEENLLFWFGFHTISFSLRYSMFSFFVHLQSSHWIYHWKKNLIQLETCLTATSKEKFRWRD